MSISLLGPLATDLGLSLGALLPWRTVPRRGGPWLCTRSSMAVLTASSSISSRNRIASRPDRLAPSHPPGTESPCSRHNVGFVAVIDEATSPPAACRIATLHEARGGTRLVPIDVSAGRPMAAPIGEEQLATETEANSCKKPT